MKVQSQLSALWIGIVVYQLTFAFSPVPNRTDMSEADALMKINFSVNEIDANGLIGPVDGKRMISYKFVIPGDAQKRRAVHRIDPSVRFFRRSSDEPYDCIGEGATRELLIKLAALPFIKKIDPFYGE